MAKGIRLGLEYANDLAIQHGCKCISTDYISSHSKLKWMCAFGHSWERCLAGIRRSNSKWCPYCAGIRLTIESAKQYAINHGGFCLSDCYSYQEKQEWMCSLGHTWHRYFGDMKKTNQWCSKCSYLSRSLGIETARNIAKERGGECLSEMCDNYSEKLLWKCHQGHMWFAQLRDVHNNESWCPECERLSRSLADGLGEAHDIAQQHDGFCLSTKYINIRRKLSWMCSKGHIWDSSLTHIKHNNSWCPHCKASRRQKLLQSCLESILRETALSNFRGFDWLKRVRLLEIDLWFPELKLAIEYDGEQHFRPIKFHSSSDEDAKKAFECLQENDRIKSSLIREHPTEIRHFIRIPYTTILTEENLRTLLKEHGISV